MAIIHQVRRHFLSRNDEIVADLLYGTSAATEEEVSMVIKRKAAEISIAMAVLHGGDWRVQIDHDAAIVLITRRLRDSPKSTSKLE